jgi:hypothetical protein
MRTKDSIQLEQAYHQVLENTPSYGPTAGQASRENSNPGIVNSKGELLSGAEMQEALNILDQHSRGEITNLVALQRLEDLYRR